MSTNTALHASREAKVDALHQQLVDSVASIVTGEDWKRALIFAARFRSRSFNNTMLIWAQHRAAFDEGQVPEPTPTYVAGFKQWLAPGRQVSRGQRGYGILAPVTERLASRNPADAGSWRRLGRGERPQRGEVLRTRLVRLKPAHVWDISQTEGEPIPEVPRPRLLAGAVPKGLWDGLADQITARGFEVGLVSSAAAIGGANGITDFLSREVSVRVDMDDAAQAKTLAHELGHVILHAPRTGDLSTGLDAGLDTSRAPDAALHRGIAEVEAESVALMVAAAHGLDTSTYTVPYVATWASTVPGKAPIEVVQATAERVRTTAVSIIDKLANTPKTGDGNPPGLDREALARRSETAAIDTPVRRGEALGL